jgi:hypothetical protein
MICNIFLVTFQMHIVMSAKIMLREHNKWISTTNEESSLYLRVQCSFPCIPSLPIPTSLFPTMYIFSYYPFLCYSYGVSSFRCLTSTRSCLTFYNTQCLQELQVTISQILVHGNPLACRNLFCGIFATYVNMCCN